MHSPAGDVGREVVDGVEDAGVGFEVGDGVGFVVAQKEQPPHKRAISPGVQCLPLFCPPL